MGLKSHEGTGGMKRLSPPTLAGMVGSALPRHGSTNVGQPAAGRGPPLGIHIRRQAKGAKLMTNGNMNHVRYVVKASV